MKSIATRRKSGFTINGIRKEEAMNRLSWSSQTIDPRKRRFYKINGLNRTKASDSSLPGKTLGTPMPETKSSDQRSSGKPMHFSELTCLLDA